MFTSNEISIQVHGLVQIGSGGGDAIAIRDELVEGSSRPSNTFQSPELVPGGREQKYIVK